MTHNQPIKGSIDAQERFMVLFGAFLRSSEFVLIEQMVATFDLIKHEPEYRNKLKDLKTAFELLHI